VGKTSKHDGGWETRELCVISYSFTIGEAVCALEEIVEVNPLTFDAFVDSNVRKAS